MNAQISNLAPPGSRCNGARRRKMSPLAALAASASFAAIASPAHAQCIEGPPNTFTCSGQTDVPQIIIADDAKVTTNPGFEVDTSNNGNGIALQVTGDGLISFEGSPDLTGAGARFSTTGSSGLSAGELSIFSNGTIFANGANGLRLDNAGGGDTTAVWVGSINNIAGNGVFTSSAFGAGDLSLIVDDVNARDDGIWVQYAGNGSATITATDPVIAHTGAGLRINAGAAADDIDVTVGDVIGGSWGIVIDSQGTDIVKVDAGGVVTGLSEAGIAVVAGSNTTGIDIRAAQVNGLVSGIQTDNQGIGDTVIAATGPVSSSGNGIFAINGASARDISIAATDVSGFYGIRSFNEGTGATSITATGLVDGTDYGIIAQNIGGSTDLNIRAANVSANGNGIEVENFGSGTTSVVVDTVTGLGDVGVRITTANSAGSVDLTVGDVTGGESGAVISNGGIGAARLTATGTVTGVGNIGINVNNHASATDIEIHAHNVNAGSYFGVLGLNQGTGDTLIETTGLVAVADTFGIIGLNEATARNMTVSAVDVIAGRGLSITNSGTGTTDVVSTGTVTGYASEGVVVANKGTATDLRVDVNVVNGNSSGMLILNSGTGSTSIRASGTVTGATLNGIEAEIGPGAQGVTIDAVDVTGGISGIFVDNDGADIAKVNASGIVTGLGATGIEIQGGENTTGIDIRANAVNGQTHGILAMNAGSGDTNIAATGPVAGTTGFGIRALSDAGTAGISIVTGDVAGTYGIVAASSGTGATSVVSTGNVVGFAGDAVRIENKATATDALVNVHNAEGALFGIQVANDGTGTTTVRASGTVTGQDFDGIVIKAGTAAQDVVVDAVDVTGSSGVTVTNFGVGSASVSTTGTVTGENITGIAIVGGTGSTDIRVSAVGVQGGLRGIDTGNDGTGETFIATTGLVSGGEAGIFARNGVGATDVTVRASEVEGGIEGIGVENYGSGTTTVIAGTASGASGAGIRVFAAPSAGGVAVNAGTVSGGFHGILARNQGAGSTAITTTGLVAGGTYGIRAGNDLGSTGDLTIHAADVQGGGWGIAATNFGSGETTVVATGTVAAGEDVGIFAIGGENAGDVTVLAASVSGGLGGIRVINGGTGATSIQATGPVSGTEFGILAENGQSATDLTIRAADVQAITNGITAENLGSGETQVTATGTVTAQEVGILVFAGANSGDITVEAGNASGGLSGISAINYGLGDTRITVNGVAQGDTNGVQAFSDGNQGVVIVNNGTIRNGSGLGSGRAISASGGSVGIGNAGSLLGTVEIAGDSSLLINSGNWRSTGGTSNFATLDDTLLNATTGIIVGGASAAAETTVWQGLERFQNNGMLRLQDGGVGDIVQTAAATVFANGSALTVDIAGATGADSFRTSGTVQIAAGSRLQAVATQPLVLHGKHVVVQADGGLTGQFVFEDQLLTAFAGLRDGYTPTSAFIEFVQLKALASAGLTPNQKAAAAGADSLPDGNIVKDALLLLPSDAAAQAAFDQLSGEIHPSARNAMVEDSRLVRGAVLDRLTDGDPGSGIWGRLFSTSGMSDGDYNAAELDRDTKGGVIGLDRGIGPVTIGIAGGWTETKLRLDRRDSSGTIKGVHGMVYARARFGEFGLRSGVGYAGISTETTRRTAFQGFSASPTADYDGSVLQGFVETGYRLPLGGGHVEPFASLTAIRAKTDAFTEVSGPAALSGAAISETTMSSMLGARFETSRVGPVSLRGTVGWRHGWGDLERVGLHAFAGGTPFTILGTTGSKNAGVFNAEARFRLSPSATLSVGYDGVLGSGNADHAITGGLKIVF